ncbi:MAG: hypothetical protein QOI10_1770 [Solirubrobacterales bacterium]|jgi:hypothetical protein|nr:hypothetical protein [Solirubrobacterales bacterium]
MDLDEHTGVEDNLERNCGICGATLTAAEIEASRETGGPFLCSTHATEVLPVAEDAAPAGEDPADL